MLNSKKPTSCRQQAFGVSTKSWLANRHISGSNGSRVFMTSKALVYGRCGSQIEHYSMNLKERFKGESSHQSQTGGDIKARAERGQ